MVLHVWSLDQQRGTSWELVRNGNSQSLTPNLLNQKRGEALQCFPEVIPMPSQG